MLDQFIQLIPICQNKNNGTLWEGKPSYSNRLMFCSRQSVSKRSMTIRSSLLSQTSTHLEHHRKSVQESSCQKESFQNGCPNVTDAVYEISILRCSHRSHLSSQGVILIGVGNCFSKEIPISGMGNENSDTCDFISFPPLPSSRLEVECRTAELLNSSNKDRNPAHWETLEIQTPWQSA